MSDLFPKHEKTNGWFSLLCFLLLSFTSTLAVVQIAILALGDQFNEQSFVNVCWVISLVTAFVLFQIKVNMVIAKIRKDIKEKDFINASSYIRQGDDAELMTAK